MENTIERVKADDGNWWDEIKCPKFEVQTSDFVSYHVTDLDTGKKESKPDAVCYASHMSKLTKTEFKLCPSTKTSKDRTMRYDPFLRWINLCKENWIVPPDAEPYQEHGKICMRLNGHGKSRHQMYAALSCYRWASTNAEICNLVLHILDLRPQIHFFQALHFSLRKYLYNSGHSFLAIQGTYHAAYGPRKEFLIHSLPGTWFFRNADHPESPCRKAKQEGYTVSAIDEYVKGLKFNSSFYPYSDDVSNRQSLILNNLNHVLWDEWTDLYRLDKPDRDWVLEYYDIVTENHGYPKRKEKKCSSAK